MQIFEITVVYSSLTQRSDRMKALFEYSSSKKEIH